MVGNGWGFRLRMEPLVDLEVKCGYLDRMMGARSKRLILYGNPASQPSKAVYWACLSKGLPFTLHADLAELRGPELPKLNPKRQIPVLIDGEFVLYEMPAMLLYLADKHGWADLCPTDLETRARINQYLHFHHSTTRLATFKLMAPHVTIAFGGPGTHGLDIILRESIRTTMDGPDPLGEGRKTLELVAGLIEKGYFPNGSTYVCGTDGPSIADLACYEELAQLTWANLFEFSTYPKITRWLEAMRAVPAHDAVHHYNVVLGDIRSEPNTMAHFTTAIEEGLEALDAHDEVVLVRV